MDATSLSFHGEALILFKGLISFIKGVFAKHVKYLGLISGALEVLEFIFMITIKTSTCEFSIDIAAIIRATAIVIAVI